MLSHLLNCFTFYLCLSDIFVFTIFNIQPFYFKSLQSILVAVAKYLNNNLNIFTYLKILIFLIITYTHRFSNN